MQGLHPRLRANSAFRRWTSLCAAVLLFAVYPGSRQAQAIDSPAPQSVSAPASAAKPAQEAVQLQESVQARPVRNSDRRRAAALYLAASKLFERELFEEAMRDYERAATLDPGNVNYPLAASVARNHVLMTLIQAAAKDRMRGDEPGARAALAHALELDPKNIQVSQHLYELGDDALLGQSKPLYEEGAEAEGTADELAPQSGVHSFHLRTGQRQIFEQVFKAYGIQATVDESIPALPARLDVDNASFATAARLLELATKAFYVPLDAHRVLVARDSNENRQKYQRLELETVYLPGLSSTELTDVNNLAKNVFDAQQAIADPTSGTITLRAPEKTLNAFNATMRELLDGQSQVLLDVRVIQLAHTNSRNTGAQLPQSMGVFNVAAEAESVFKANQSTIQQIISSGLASPTDFMAILAILVASGSVSNSPLASGFATFGGSLTNCTNGVFLQRRSDNIWIVTGHDHGQPESELLRFARAGSDSVAAGRRRGHNPALRHALSHPDFFFFEPGGQRIQHRWSDRRGQLQQPVFAAGFLRQQRAECPAGGVPGPGPDSEGNPEGDAQQRGCAQHRHENRRPGRKLHQRQSYSQQSSLFRGGDAETGRGSGGGQRHEQVGDPLRERHAGIQRDSRNEQCDRQGYREELCDSSDRDDTPCGPRHPGGRPLADDADRTWAKSALTNQQAICNACCIYESRSSRKRNKGRQA